MRSKIRSAWWGFCFPSWSIPIALLGLTLLSYGLRIEQLGFYWDDWPYLWFFERLGPAGIVSAFSGDRPFLSFIYTTSLTVLGKSIQAWQWFGLLARWLCATGLWWSLAQAWPRQSSKAAWAAALFLVYPGFTQQWIAVIYGQAFFLFAALFFSIGLTLWLARRRDMLQPGWAAADTLLALALSTFTMFSTEYFFGLELLRPVLLWLVFAGQHPPATATRRADYLRLARQTLAWWSPFLALMLVFVVWRSVILPFAGYEMRTLESFTSSPLQTAWNLVLTVLHDLITASFAAWGQPLQALSGLYDNGAGSGLRLLAVIAITGLLAWLFFARLRNGAGERLLPAPPLPESWGAQALIVGLLAMLVSGLPTWLTALPLRMGFPQDRFSLSMSVGVSLALAGLIDLAGKDLARKAFLLALAVGLAAGFHFDTARRYDEDWDLARDFFWQLTWRAPSISPNTLLATVDMPFAYFEDDSLTAPLNWTYDPQGTSPQIAYLLYDLDVRRNSMPGYEPGIPIERDFRATRFSGSTSQVLLFSYQPPGCLRILDPGQDAALFRLPNKLLQTMPLSNPRLLIRDENPGAAPPAAIFGDEPKHRWCYYYQKAELARQTENWEAIKTLAGESIRQGIVPDDPAEYLPFIEAYARTWMFDDAYELSLSTLQQAPYLQPALCAVWQRVSQAGIVPYEKHQAQLLETHQCKMP